MGPDWRLDKGDRRLDLTVFVLPVLIPMMGQVEENLVTRVEKVSRSTLSESRFSRK